MINSIQEGMAAELNFQAIVDLVGDKLREVFHTGEIGIRWYDAKANLLHYLYEYEHGVRLDLPSAAPRDTRDLVAHRRGAPAAGHEQPCPDDGNGHHHHSGHRHGPFVGPRSHPRRRPRARHHHHGGLRARERVRRGRGAPADDGGREHGRGAGERAPVRRDAAAVQGERAARRRARDHQQRPAGARRRAQHAGDLRRGRRQDPRDLQPGGCRHPHLRPADEPDPVPVFLRERAADRHRVHTAVRQGLRRPRPAHSRDAGHQREHGAGRSKVTAAWPCPERRWRNRRSSSRWWRATRRAESST